MLKEHFKNTVYEKKIFNIYSSSNRIFIVKKDDQLLSVSYCLYKFDLMKFFDDYDNLV